MVKEILKYLDDYKSAYDSNTVWNPLLTNEERRIVRRTINDIRDYIADLVEKKTTKPDGVISTGCLTKNESIALELTKVWVPQSDTIISKEETVDIFSHILRLLNGMEVSS